MTDNTYTPRPGTKVAQATQAMLDGPMPTVALGAVMDCPPGNVSAFLKPALENGFIIKLKDESGLLHFSLKGMVVDERFTPFDSGGGGTSPNALGKPLTEAPLVRSVKSPAVGPSAAAIAFANPFAKFRSSTAAPRETYDELKERLKRPAGAKPAAEASPPPASPLTQDPAVEKFVAGMFSNGDLQIAVGDKNITLCLDHTRQLRTFLDKIKEIS